MQVDDFVGLGLVYMSVGWGSVFKRKAKLGPRAGWTKWGPTLSCGVGDRDGGWSGWWRGSGGWVLIFWCKENKRNEPDWKKKPWGFGIGCGFGEGLADGGGGFRIVGRDRGEWATTSNISLLHRNLHKYIFVHLFGKYFPSSYHKVFCPISSLCGSSKMPFPFYTACSTAVTCCSWMLRPNLWSSTLA